MVKCVELVREARAGFCKYSEYNQSTEFLQLVQNTATEQMRSVHLWDYYYKYSRDLVQIIYNRDSK